VGHSDQKQPLFPGSEKRLSVRVVYETLLLVAEWDGAAFPPFSAFWEVQAKDLSATGVGFLSDREPKAEHLLLMFGNPQAKPIFIKARVVHRAILQTPQGVVYRVGCELLQRMTS